MTKYASNVDYAKLYAKDYYAHATGVTSFGGKELPKTIVKIARALGLNSVLDVSGGNGTLGQVLEAEGLVTLTTDYAQSTQANKMFFDLSGTDANAAAGVSAQIQKLNGGAAYLSTCFDVMEHIDIEDIADALYNLNAVSAEWGFFSVSTRISQRCNMFHCSIYPRETWVAMLKAAGFEPAVIAEWPALGTTISRVISPAKHLAQGNTPDRLLLAHWRTVDVFRDQPLGEPWYGLYRKTGKPASREALRAKIATILDAEYRHAMRRDFGDFTSKTALNIASAADFITLRPLLDVLPRGSVTALIRDSLFIQRGQQDMLGLIQSFCLRSGYDVTVYRAAADITWSGLQDTTLVTAVADDMAAQTVNVQTIVAAQTAGLKTIGFGAASDSAPVAACCTTILSSAALRNYAVAPDTLLNRLGVTAPAARTVLIDSTQNWQQQAAAQPNHFFIVILPGSTAMQTQTDLPNVLLIDEAILIDIDLPLCRLMQAVGTCQIAGPTETSSVATWRAQLDAAEVAAPPAAAFVKATEAMASLLSDYATQADALRETAQVVPAPRKKRFFFG